jgi:hypothetical protein
MVIAIGNALLLIFWLLAFRLFTPPHQIYA